MTALNRSIKVRVDNSESDFRDYYAVQSRLRVVQQTVDIVDIVELLQHAATIASQAPPLNAIPYQNLW